MSIKQQKIIRFIPFVNFFVIAIQYLLMFHRNVVPNKGKRIFRTLLFCMLGGVIVMVLEILLDSIFQNESMLMVINFLSSLLWLFIISCVLVFEQEKFERDRNAQRETDTTSLKLMSQPFFEAVEKQEEPESIDQPIFKPKAKKKLPLVVKILIAIVSIPIVFFVGLFIFFFIEAIIEGI